MSGDLVRILTPHSRQQVTEPKTQAGAQGVTSCQAQSGIDAQSGSRATACCDETAKQDSVMQVDNTDVTDPSAASFPPEEHDCVQDHEVNHYLREPMLIRDSTWSSVPQTLQLAWKAAETSIDHHALVLVTHVLMTEVGFTQKVICFLR